jgi:hypothetical protein
MVMPSRLRPPVAAPEAVHRPRPRRSGRLAVLLVLGALISAGTWAVPSAWAVPLLSLDKEATLDLGVNGTLEAGDEIDYEFTITNAGTVLLSSLDLDDALLGLTDATCGATSLLPLVATSCTASYELSQGDIDAGVVTNVAEVCAIPFLAALELCDTDSTSTILDAELLIDLEKEATLDLGTNGTLEAGDELVFDFTIGNLGNVTLSGIDLDFWAKLPGTFPVRS